MKTLLAAAALAAAMTAAPASAEPQRTLTVHYADLDLASADGQRLLDRRIANAAAAACGTPSSADPRSRRAVHECRAEIAAVIAPQRDRAIAAARAAGASLAAR